MSAFELSPLLKAPSPYIRCSQASSHLKLHKWSSWKQVVDPQMDPIGSCIEPNYPIRFSFDGSWLHNWLQTGGLHVANIFYGSKFSEISRPYLAFWRIQNNTMSWRKKEIRILKSWFTFHLKNLMQNSLRSHQQSFSLAKTSRWGRWSSRRTFHHVPAIIRIRWITFSMDFQHGVSSTK